jgi:DNA-binding response OmpR family regulator
MTHLSLMTLSAAPPRAAVVLVVEDDGLVRLTTADYLDSCGYTVLQASSTAAAKRCFDDTAIDLVFTDVNMPGAQNGIDLAVWVQANHPGVPVLVTSGGAVVLPAGIGALLMKPYDLDGLHRRIQAALIDNDA